MVFLASSCGAIDNKLTNATVLTLRSTGRPVSGTLRIGMAAQAPVSFTLKVSCGSNSACRCPLNLTPVNSESLGQKSVAPSAVTMTVWRIMLRSSALWALPYPQSATPATARNHRHCALPESGFAPSLARRSARRRGRWTFLRGWCFTDLEME